MAQRNAAVVGGEGRGRDGFKAEAGEPLAYAFEQELILEHAAGENGGLAAMGLRERIGRFGDCFYEAAMKAGGDDGPIRSGGEVSQDRGPKRRPAELRGLARKESRAVACPRPGHRAFRQRLQLNGRLPFIGGGVEAKPQRGGDSIEKAARRGRGRRVDAALHHAQAGFDGLPLQALNHLKPSIARPHVLPAKEGVQMRERVAPGLAHGFGAAD